MEWGVTDALRQEVKVRDAEETLPQGCLRFPESVEEKKPDKKELLRILPHML